MNEILDEAAKAGAGKAAEGIVDRLFNGLLNILAFLLKRIYAPFYKLIYIQSGLAFHYYLKNRKESYKIVKTIATGNSTVSLAGPDGIYVETSVRIGDKDAIISMPKQLFPKNKHILIEGNGGTGKSMLMRYLFVETATEKKWIPVLIDLRKLSYSGSTSDEIIMNEVLKTFHSYYVRLTKAEICDCLKDGKFLILLDGFDEIPESKAAEVAHSIIKFFDIYNKNPCIITSRPNAKIKPRRFEIASMIPLSKHQAEEVVKKLGNITRANTSKLRKQINEALYESEEYGSFVKNPLLLSMLFLVFVKNAKIPNRLYFFYEKAYQVLYNEHDLMEKEETLQRKFHCDCLGETDFKKLFARFCMQTYFREKYEFSEDEMLRYIDDSIMKLGFSNFTSRNFLDDLCSNLCLITRDGNIYSFVHRSFQTYFAAYYLSRYVSDANQQDFFKKKSHTETCNVQDDFYELLFQIDSEKFGRNMLRSGLSSLIAYMDTSIIHNDDIMFTLINLDNENARDFKESSLPKMYREIYHDYIYYQNLLFLFDRYFARYSSVPYYFDFDKNTHSKDFALFKMRYENKINVRALEYDIRKWLSNMDAKDRNKTKDSFLDFLDNL